MDGKAFVSFLIISCLLLSEYSKADEFSFLSALIKNCDAVDEKKILFLLYTRQHEDEYVLTVDDQEALKNSTYDINKPTKVFVHGYLNDGTFGEDVKSGYLKKEDVNYIGVDWGTYAKCEPVEVFYDVIPAVAKVVAKMLRQLYDYGSKPEDITLIGFSFGSDVVAETNQDLAEQQAPFIIALDPAGLVISFLPPIQRLDTGDAKFVLVLHTNLLISSMINRLGHAEFFANGGLLQPGCGLDPSCSHKRAVDYFAESLTSETGFYGIECDNHVSYFIGLCNSNKQVIFSEDTPKDCLLLSDYSNADGSSFLSALVRKCIAVDEKKILFLLYTRQHDDKYVLIVDDQEALKKSTYDVNKPTKVFVHGYLNDGTFGETLKSGYLKKEDVNYINVDWSTYARCEPVKDFHDIVPTVAKVVAKMLRQLYDYGSKPKDITLIGFSFGAHVVAETNQDLAEQQAPFIIALDPAGLVVSFIPPTERLDTSDAKFVLVLHTNLLVSAMVKRLGHAEFFANVGLLQPGCGLDLVCSHKRAVDYFVESLTSETGFYGVECDNRIVYLTGLCNSNKQVIFGEETPKDTRGKYYFRTNSKEPYAKGNTTST